MLSVFQDCISFIAFNKPVLKSAEWMSLEKKRPVLALEVAMGVLHWGDKPARPSRSLPDGWDIPSECKIQHPGPVDCSIVVSNFSAPYCFRLD